MRREEIAISTGIVVTPPPLWITSYENNQMKVFATGPDLDEDFVAAFSYEEAEEGLYLMGDD